MPCSLSWGVSPTFFFFFFSPALRPQTGPGRAFKHSLHSSCLTADNLQPPRRCPPFSPSLVFFFSSSSFFIPCFFFLFFGLRSFCAFRYDTWYASTLSLSCSSAPVTQGSAKDKTLRSRFFFFLPLASCVECLATAFVWTTAVPRPGVLVPVKVLRCA